MNNLHYGLWTVYRYGFRFMHCPAPRVRLSTLNPYQTSKDANLFAYGSFVNEPTHVQLMLKIDKPYYLYHPSKTTLALLFLDLRKLGFVATKVSLVKGYVTKEYVLNKKIELVMFKLGVRNTNISYDFERYINSYKL